MSTPVIVSAAILIALAALLCGCTNGVIDGTDLYPPLGDVICDVDAGADSDAQPCRYPPASPEAANHP